jgi:arsenite methyltransferase
MDDLDIKEIVRARYAGIAAASSPASCCEPAAASCCGPSPSSTQQLAAKALRMGYSTADLATVPDGANLGLGCGNPQAIAAMQPGETIVDLGSGAGFDCFLAARQVGPAGRVIGVDMTHEMLAKARANATKVKAENVEFRLGEIEHLPVGDRSVDVVISNCVINLSPDKPQVWREMARVLKPGGRVAVSDLALLQPLPPAVREMVEAVIGCVAGAVLVDETERMARAAGLSGIVLTKKSGFLKAKADWNDPLYQKIAKHLPAGTHTADFVTSLEIQARKPQT